MKGTKKSQLQPRQLARLRQALPQRRRSVSRSNQLPKHPLQPQNSRYPRNSTRRRRRNRQRSRIVTILVIETVAMLESLEIIGIIATTGTIATIVITETTRAAEIIESTLHRSTLQMVATCQGMCQQSLGRLKSNRGARSSRSLEKLGNLEYAW